MQDFKLFYLRWLMAILMGAAVDVQAQTVISDSTFNNADWTTMTVSEFGAAQTNHQEFSGGNPGAFRYMEHLLPAPPGLNDLAIVQVTHIYEAETYDPGSQGAIDHINYSEDFALLNLPWDQAFVASTLAIIQDGRGYRATRFVNVIGVTGWMSGNISNLQADDFVALDGSNEKPDFSESGSEMQFGFWRTHSRGATQPPIPSNEILTYEHGIDNFTVALHAIPPSNQAPIAEDDFFFYFNYASGGLSTFPVLNNDSDPDGDPIRILSVTEPNIGTIASFDDNSVTYYVEPSVFPIFFPSIVGDSFVYFITDGEDSSGTTVFISFCACPVECLAPLPEGAPHTSGTPTAKDYATSATHSDSLDVELFRRFRDDVLLPTETGSRFVDLYYRSAPEVMPLFLFDRPDLATQAMRALQMVQKPLRNLIEEDGNMAISQTLVDSVGAFLDSLDLAISDSLRDSLNVQLARLGPLQGLVGLPVGEAADKALADSIATHVGDIGLTPDDFVLQQNFPNPFNPTTTIKYSIASAQRVSLKVYDVLGREVATLVDARQDAVEYSVSFDGTGLPSSIYLARLQAGKTVRLRKMLLVR